MKGIDSTEHAESSTITNPSQTIHRGHVKKERDRGIICTESEIAASYYALIGCHK